MISTRQAAKRLGLAAITLSHYISVGKVPAPKVVTVAGMRIHDWTEEEIEHVRQLLPKIKNGRKTRYQKQKSGARSQKSVKTRTKKQPQPKAAHSAPGSSAVPHKQHKKKH